MNDDLATLRKINVDIGVAESVGDRARLNEILASRFAFRRASGQLVNREEYLDKVAPSPQRGTRVDELAIFGDRAVVMCVVEQDGVHYHNIRLFVREGGEWRLLGWANERTGQFEPNAAAGGAPP